jgi:hypothetical protein
MPTPSYSTDQKERVLQKMSQVLDIMERRLAEEIASKTPEAQAARGATCGAESAVGSEDMMEAANRKFKKELSNPAFAGSYFAAQRITRAKVLRRYSMLPQRCLA